LARIQARISPANDPRNAVIPLRVKPPIKKLTEAVSIATTPSATGIGPMSLRKRGIRTFQIVKAEKTKERNALRPVKPATANKNTQKKTIKTSSWVSR